MLTILSFLKQKFGQLSEAKNKYKALRKHLDTMPMGFPPTISGVEIRLLKALFTPDEAVTALALNYKAEPFEIIYSRAVQNGIPKDNLKKHLKSMEKKGVIFAKDIDDITRYCLLPFIIGFFETQVKDMTAGFYLDTRQYGIEGLAIEYMTTSVPQMRVIPVEKSITPEHKIATYDEIRKIINKADNRIGVAECICKKGHDLIGDPCKKTDRREICLCFSDFYDTFTRNKWARTITKKQALDILAQSEKDGLVLQPSNETNPQFVCSCCSCCCGILEMFSMFSRPADFVASNFHASLDLKLCIKCGKCEDRCQMNAIKIKDEKPILDQGKCIGCGLCVSTCKPNALTLVKKDKDIIPPKNNEALLDAIMENKKTWPGKLSMTAKGIMGLKV